MKRTHFCLALVMLSALALTFSAGCAAFRASPVGQMVYGKTAADKLAGAEKSFKAVNDTYAKWVADGEITDTTAISQWREAQLDIQAAFTLAHAKIDGGDQAAVDAAVETVVSKLTLFLLHYGNPPPATQPSTRPVALWDRTAAMAGVA